MKKYSIVLLSIFSFLFLFSCNNKENAISKQNNFTREWFSIDGHLKINSKNTFEYVRYTCISKSISKGKWLIINDTLVLNSYKPKGCYFIENFEIVPPKDSINIIAKSKSDKNCNPIEGYVIFKNEKFYLKDTLLLSKRLTNYNGGRLNQHTNFRKNRYYHR